MLQTYMTLQVFDLWKKEDHLINVSAFCPLSKWAVGTDCLVCNVL